MKFLSVSPTTCSEEVSLVCESNAEIVISVPLPIIPISGSDKTLACLIVKSSASESRTKFTSSEGSAISFPSGGLTISSGSQTQYLTFLLFFLSSITIYLSSNSTSGYSNKEYEPSIFVISYIPKFLGISSTILAFAKIALVGATVLITFPCSKKIPLLILAKFFKTETV